MHDVMAIFALTGTFLSFFHQGSLGGVAGVLFGRPYAYRAGLFIWPWTFFLFILSAIASGPAFTALICRAIERVSGKKLVDRSVYELIGKIEGVLLGIYMILKIADTAYWAFVQSPKFGLTLGDFYWGPYGIWLLVAEIGICGVLPAIILLSPSGRRSNFLLFGAFLLEYYRRIAESLRNDYPCHRRACDALRQVAGLYSNGLRNCAYSCDAGLLHSNNFTFLQVPAPFPARKGTQPRLVLFSPGE